MVFQKKKQPASIIRRRRPGRVMKKRRAVRRRGPIARARRRLRGRRPVRRGGLRRRFTKRGGRRRMRARKAGVITYHCSSNVPPAGPAGLLPINIGSFPAVYNTTDGVNPPGTTAERIIAGVVGVYSFDFTRLAVSQYSDTIGTYQRLRFGPGFMTIRRIDTGANWGVFAPTAPATGGASMITLGTRAVPLKMYYRYLRPDESTANNSLVSELLADRGTRSRILMPGRRFTFKFIVRSYTHRNLGMLGRTYSAAGDFGTTENNDVRTLKIPSRPRPLGWIPANLVGISQPVPPGVGNPLWGSADNGTFGGLGATQFRFMGRTVLMCFESMGPGAFTATDQESVPLGVYNPQQVPLIVRQERMSFTLAGPRKLQNLQPGIAYLARPYPIGDPGTTPMYSTYNTTTFRAANRPPANVGGTVSVTNGFDNSINVEVPVTQSVVQPALPVVY